MWHEYHQTYLDNYIENNNLCCHILIEADSTEEANIIAKDIGIIFEEDYGYEFYICRWQRCYYELEFPSKWDNKYIFYTPEEYCNFLYERKKKYNHKKTKVHSRIFYKNKNIKEVGIDNDN